MVEVDRLTIGKTKKRRRRPWEKKFLTALEDTGNVSEACRRAGVSRTIAYELCRLAADFAAAWEAAMEIATDALELEARRRAREGVRRLKFYQGVLIQVPLLDEEGKPVKDEAGQVMMTPYVEQEYSDALLALLLKAHRPEKFRENVDITSGGKPLPLAVLDMPIEEL